MDCPHGVPLDTMCVQCEYEREQADIEAMRGDPYECMPFGDLQRMEDEACFRDLAAGEGREGEMDALQDEYFQSNPGGEDFDSE